MSQCIHKYNELIKGIIAHRYHPKDLFIKGIVVCDFVYNVVINC